MPQTHNHPKTSALKDQPTAWTFFKPGWWLLVIVAVAFLARITVVHYGLPLLLYEDEPIYYDHALGFGLGHWNIGYFKKPSFFLYFYGAFYYLAFLYSQFMDWKDYVNAFWQDPTYVATVGRTLSVIFASGTVYMLGRIGHKAYSWGVGLLAAFFLAVDFTHVSVSPIVISDIPALFFIVCAAWFALKIAESAHWKEYLLCAAAIALAASFKYNIFSVFFLLAGHIAFHCKQNFHWKAALFQPRLWVSFILIPLLFLALNPLILSDFSTFWDHLHVEKRHMLQHTAQESWKPMAAFDRIFFKILPRNLGWLLYIPGFLGLLWGCWRYRKPTLILLSFPLVFLLVVLQFQLINAKYLLPLFPFWYLAAALGFRDLFNALRAKLLPGISPIGVSLLAGILTIGISFWTWGESIKHLIIYSKADTRNIASDHIQTRAHKNDRLLLEPDTLTLSNRIYRSWTLIATAQDAQYQIKQLPPNAIREIDLSALKPQYVLLNLGEAEKRKDAQGKLYYKMPNAPAYYHDLQTDYRLKAVFFPCSIHLTQQAMETRHRKEGITALYTTIQAHSSPRLRPGPSMFLMERL